MPNNRMAEFVTLTQDEESSLLNLLREPIHVARRSVIRGEGASVDHIYVLVEGWAASSLILRDGTRQISKVHLPRDVLGATSLASRAAVDCLFALSDCLIQPIPVARLSEVFANHPRLGASLFLSANKERVALMDTLASVARQSSTERLARFLLDLYDRLVSLNLTGQNRLTLFITQEEIGDVIGLTSVHVNRTFQALKSQGLISGRGCNIELDIDKLRAISQLPPRAYDYEPTWLSEVATT